MAAGRRGRRGPHHRHCLIVADNRLYAADAGTPFAELVRRASAMNLSESVLLLAPIMLLFSYTRTHKNKTFDLLIPAIGVVAVVLAFIEGLYPLFLMFGPSVEAALTELAPIIDVLASGLTG